MKRNKTFAFVASVIEIVLACVYFFVFATILVDLLMNYSLLAENYYDLQSLILSVCVMFGLSVMMIVDGIISLRVSRENCERFEKFKRANLAMGVVFCVLAVLSLFTFSIFYYFVGVVILLSFFLFIVIGVFNILSATLPNKVQTKNTQAICQVKKQVEESANMEAVLTRIEKLSELYKAGLISSEEFEKIKNNILSK